MIALHTFYHKEERESFNNDNQIEISSTPCTNINSEVCMANQIN